MIIILWLFILCSTVSQIEFVIHAACVDKLEYWERDPKFFSHRRLDTENSNVENVETVAEDDTDPKYDTGTLSDTERRTFQSGTSVKKPVIQKHNATAHLNQGDTKQKNMPINANLAEERIKSNKPIGRAGGQEMRAQKKRPLRSTRMDDSYKIPLQNSEETSKKKQPKDNDPDGLITPVTLKQQLEQLETGCVEANITTEIIGRTIEFHDIVLMKVTQRPIEGDRHFRVDEHKYADDVPEKKIVFIVHALSVMGVKHLPCLNKIDKLNQLLKYYFEHLDKFDIFIIPMANPDGFITTVSDLTKTYVNKNNSPQSACPGVALDRNFEVAWNSSAKVNSCSPQYPGSKPFSEPESRAIRDVFHHYSHKIIAYIHVHGGTYDRKTKKGDAVLYPKGYTDAQSDDDKYIDLKGEIDEAMKNASFRVLTVTVDTLHNWYGKVTGTSVDYAATIYGIPYALEFVMQPYADINIVTNPFGKEYASQAALEEIWKRIIDVTFNNIYRNMKNNDL